MRRPGPPSITDRPEEPAKRASRRPASPALACLELLNRLHGAGGSAGLELALTGMEAIFGHELAIVAAEETGHWRMLERGRPRLPPALAGQARALFLEALQRELGAIPPGLAGTVESRAGVEAGLPGAGRRRTASAPASVESFVVLPLKLDDARSPGLLGLFSTRPRCFTPGQVRLVSLLSPGLAAAVRNSSIVSGLRRENRSLSAEVQESERQMALAREVQAHLLPAPPAGLSGLSVAAFSRPVSSVGGDLYAFRVLDDGAFGVLMADVSGKGVAAALLSALTKGLLAGLSRDQAARPKTVLTRLNRALAEELSEDRFVTAVYAVLAPERRRLAFASAGHEPILFYEAAADRVVAQAASGLPLGIESSFEYHAQRMACGPGDCLLFFTDGVLPRGEPNGYAALAALFAGAARRAPDAGGITAILSAELARDPRTRHDDIACVVVKLL